MLSAHHSPGLDHTHSAQTRTDTYSIPHSSLPTPSIRMSPSPALPSLSPHRTLPRVDDISGTSHETPHESRTFQDYGQEGQGSVPPRITSSRSDYLDRPSQAGRLGLGLGSTSEVESPTIPNSYAPGTSYSEMGGLGSHAPDHGHGQGQGQVYGGSFTGTPTFDPARPLGQMEGGGNVSSASIGSIVMTSMNTPTMNTTTDTTTSERPLIEQSDQRSTDDRPKSRPKPKPRGKGKPKPSSTSASESATTTTTPSGTTSGTMGTTNPKLTSRSRSKSKFETTRPIHRSDIPSNPYIIPPSSSTKSTVDMGTSINKIYPQLGQSGFLPSSGNTAKGYTHGGQGPPADRSSSGRQWGVEGEPAVSPLHSAKGLPDMLGRGEDERMRCAGDGGYAHGSAGMMPSTFGQMDQPNDLYSHGPAYAGGFGSGGKSASTAGYSAGGVNQSPNQYASGSGGYMGYHHQGILHPHQQLGQSPYIHSTASIVHSAPVSRHVSSNAQFGGLSSVGSKGERLGSPAETRGGRSGGRSASGLRVGMRSVSATDIRGVGADTLYGSKSTRHEPSHPYRPPSRLATIAPFHARPPSSPYYQAPIDPRPFHTTQNTPAGSPETTPGPGGAFSTRVLNFPGQVKKGKYKRSRTGCLGCRAKRIKCDETRPVCRRCVDGKKEMCIYPALHELPKATIRALAARKRIDSGGESTGDEVMVDDRKRVKASAESQGATSVDAYMNEIDNKGNMRNEYGLLVPAMEPRPVPLGFYSYQQQLYAQQKNQQLEHQRQERLQGNSGLAWGSTGPTTTASSAAPPYTVSAQGYSSSISSYHLNATARTSKAKGDSLDPQPYQQFDSTSNFENGLYHATAIDQSRGHWNGARAVSSFDCMTDQFQPPANNGSSDRSFVSQQHLGVNNLTPPTMTGHGPLMTHNHTNTPYCDLGTTHN